MCQFQLILKLEQVRLKLLSAVSLVFPAQMIIFQFQILFRPGRFPIAFSWLQFVYFYIQSHLLKPTN